VQWRRVRTNRAIVLCGSVGKYTSALSARDLTCAVAPGAY